MTVQPSCKAKNLTMFNYKNNFVDMTVQPSCKAKNLTMFNYLFILILITALVTC